MIHIICIKIDRGSKLSPSTTDTKTKYKINLGGLPNLATIEDNEI